MLHSLCYVSRSRIGADAAEVGAIADVAQARNAAADVTGALYFDSKLFFQVLEGQKESVHAIYESILRDPRHFELRLLQDAPVHKRRFHGWSMKIVDRAGLPTGAERPRYSVLRAADQAPVDRAIEALPLRHVGADQPQTIAQARIRKVAPTQASVAAMAPAPVAKTTTFTAAPPSAAVA
jgi:hypothetical protein